MCFMIIGHIISAPSEGICLVVSPSLTTEKFNPIVMAQKAEHLDTQFVKTGFSDNCYLCLSTTEQFPIMQKSGLQALRRDTHRPYLFQKTLYFQRLEHKEYQKTYFSTNFVRKIRYIKICKIYREIGICCFYVFSCSN